MFAELKRFLFEPAFWIAVIIVVIVSRYVHHHLRWVSPVYSQIDQNYFNSPDSISNQAAKAISTNLN